MSDDIISSKEAADMLGCTTRWVTHLCSHGKLDIIDGGGRGNPFRIKRASVEQFLESPCEEDADPDNLESLASAIESDEEAIAAAERQAEESFRERVLELASQYGPLCCGVAGIILAAVGFPIIGAGIEVIALVADKMRTRAEENRQSS